MSVTDTYRIKTYLKDRHILFFLFNLILVVIGYMSVTGLGFFNEIKAVRTVLTIVGLLLLILNNRKTFYLSNTNLQRVLVVFFILNFISCLLADNLLLSLERYTILISFFLYIALIIAYFSKKYSREEVLYFSITITRFAYLIPLIIFFLFFRDYYKLSVYGDQSIEAYGLKSRTLGWAAAVVVLFSLDLFSNFNRKKYNLFIAIIAIYPLFLSGSRTSMISVAIGFVMYIIFQRSIGGFYKLTLMIFLVSITVFFIQQKDSSINTRIKKTESQLSEDSEYRYLVFSQVIGVLETNDKVLMAGVGPGNFKEGIEQYTSIYDDFDELSSHNSYLTILFEGGVFIFLYFIIFFIIPMLFNFTFQSATKLTFIYPLILIPITEENYGPGQFLFMPWMFFTFFYILRYNQKKKSIVLNIEA